MRRFILRLAVAFATLAIITGSAIERAQAAEPMLSLLHSTLPALSAAKYLSHADSGRQLQVAVTLAVADPQALDQFIGELYDPSSPNYHQFLTPEQFAAQFGPSEADYDAVKSYLASNGVTITHEYANHLVIDAKGSLAEVENAFGVVVNNYVVGGRKFFANENDVQLPVSIQAVVAGVSGLEDYLQLKPHLRPNRSRFGFGFGPGTPVGYSPQQIATAYDFTGAYGKGYTGSGQTIAIATAYNFSAPDISSFFSQFKITAPKYSVVAVDGSTKSTNVETTLDLQRSGSMAYGATIVVYEGVNANFSTFEDVYNAIVSNKNVSVVTTSWGICEPEMPSSNLNADHTIFNSAAAEGQAWFAASGDSGSNDCAVRTGNTLAVDYPSSDPNVAATGGTTLKLASSNTISSETEWSGSGGGVSIDFLKPSYQSGFSGSYRQTADVAFDADPNTGYPVYYGGRWSEYGGTSFAAPQWAAIFAIAEQSRGKLGSANPAIYGLDGASFHDITSGNNGHYSAGPGWDNPTGWGTPDVGLLITQSLL